MIKFGAFSRFYHVSNPSQAGNKYIFRLKQRAETSRLTFLKKKGHAMLMTHSEPDEILQMAAKSSTSLIKDLKSPHLSLNASHRVAHFIHELTVKSIWEVADELSIQTHLEISKIEFSEGNSRICITWKLAHNNTDRNSIGVYLKQFETAVLNKLLVNKFSALSPEIVFREHSDRVTNAEIVNNLLEKCDMSSIYGKDSNPTCFSPIFHAKSKESLQEMINRDLAGSDFNACDEPHTFEVANSNYRVSDRKNVNVYGVDRDRLIAKVVPKRKS